MQWTYQLHYLVYRHLPTKHTRNKFSVVPVFLVESFRQSFYGHLIASLVLELEVVTLVAVFIVVLDDASACYRFRQQYTFFVILQSGEDFVRTSVKQSYKGYPLFFIILETNYIGFQNLRTNFYNLAFQQCQSVELFFLVFLLLGRDKNTRTWAITIYGTSFTSRFPCFYIQTVHQLFVYTIRQVDGYADRVVYPFLDASLHFNLHQPVYIVRCSFVIRRLGYQLVYFFLRVTFVGVVSVYLHPSEELMMEYYVFFESVACFVYVVNVYILVVRVNFTATFVYRHEYRLNARCSLSHQAGGSGGRNSKTSDVSTSVLSHFGIQFRVGLLYTVYERVVFFANSIVNFECTTFFSQIYRRAVSFERQSLVYFFRKFCSFFGAVSQAHSRNHVAFGSDSHSGTTSHTRFLVNLFPEMTFRSFYFISFGVRIYLLDYLFNLFKFQVDDVIHNALCHGCVFLELFEIEISFWCERIYYIRVKIDSQQAAWIVRAKRNFTAWVCRYSAEA